MFAKFMRFYAYLYHFLLALLLLGLAAVSLQSGRALKLDMFPWKGDQLTQALLWSGIFALLSVALAVTGVFRFLFPVWTLAALVGLVRGYLLQPYRFAGKQPFYYVLWVIAGALIAFLASLTLFRPQRRLRSRVR